MNELYLDNWIKSRIEGDLETHTLAKLNESLGQVMINSPFYQKKFVNFKADIEKGLQEIKDIEKLPFTTPEELAKFGPEMLCVSPKDVSRIVSLNTSGSTGPPKRIYFTEEDQELTIDYFRHGMQYLVDERDYLLILLPCKTPGGVGDLLAKGLARLGTKVYRYGFPNIWGDAESDKLGPEGRAILEEITAIILEEKITSIVGSPQEVLALAEYSFEAEAGIGIKTVLLSTDYISDELRSRINNIWGARVYEHYGTTEMGLGGAVSCQILQGYHPRENDLYFEIVDRNTGRVLPDGEYGEVVFTTLTRKAMPLIRYKTGDISRWIPGPCPCGSSLRRMDKVLDRGVKKSR